MSDTSNLSSEACGNAQEAQELALLAMKASSSAERQRLVREALSLDPECTDALCIQTCQSGNLEVAAEKVKEIASRAEALLGETVIEAHRGRLWEHEKARPYLRARLCLADLYARSGRFKLALPHLEALLRFVPGDPLQIKYHLARCYACMGRTEQLHHLLSCRIDEGTVWTWMKILERVKAQKPQEARLLLDKARARNHHVEGFLTALHLPPKATQAEPLPGSREEAVISLRFLELPWRSDRQAMYWLFTEGKRDNPASGETP